jgi:4-amino-4-deoxy-L-arabinose transferase-like glycosyltransferase
MTAALAISRHLALILVIAFAARIGYVLIHERHAGGLHFVATSAKPLNENEEVLLAYNILSGKGYSSPKGGDTGPTAMYTPVYPYILVAACKLFGVYSRASSIAILVLNSLFGALTVLPLFYVGGRIGGQSLGLGAAWLWALYPSVIVVAGINWTQPLTALLVALILWSTLALQDSSRSWQWAGYGLLCAFTVMVNAAVFAVLPFLLFWLAWTLRKRGRNWPALPALAAFVMLVGFTPWTVRNYLVFHEFVPFRSGLGLTLWLGNNDRMGNCWNGCAQVDSTRSPTELAEYERLGEMAYDREKRQEAIESIVTHPGRTVRYTALRVAMFWIGAWYTSVDKGWSSANWRFRILLILDSLLPFLALPGLYLLQRRQDEYLFPLLVFLSFFPLVYYLTIAHLGYRWPIDPVLVVLAATPLADFSFPGVARA